MTDAPVNPALFRRRVFEAEWLSPLKAEPPELGASLDVPLRDSPGAEALSAALLRYALALEAQRWLAIGEHVGYFASAPISGMVELPQLAWILNDGGSQTAHASEFDIHEFGRALSEAQADLTPERREFLRLICFAAPSEWKARLSEISQLSRNLSRRPDLILSYEQVDRVAWGLEGGESNISRGPQDLPAGWRSNSFSEVARRSPEAGLRLGALDEVRAAIASTAERAAEVPVHPEEVKARTTRLATQRLQRTDARRIRESAGRWAKQRFRGRSRRMDVRPLTPDDEVFERIRSYLAATLGLNPQRISKDTDFVTSVTTWKCSRSSYAGS